VLTATTLNFVSTDTGEAADDADEVDAYAGNFAQDYENELYGL
jgi:hypothetical protein